MNTKEQAINNLRDIKDILDGLEITWWLDFGTLLGAYRDHDFCEGDEDDIDLSTWDNYLFLIDEIERLAVARGFTVWCKWSHELSLKKSGSKVDIFFHTKNKYDAVTHLYDSLEHSIPAKYVVTPVKYFERLGIIVFQDMTFNMPYEIESYLEHKYGDWQTKIHRKDYLCINPEQHKSIRDKYEYN